MMSQSVDIPDMITSGKNPHPPAVQTQFMSGSQSEYSLLKGGGAKTPLFRYRMIWEAAQVPESWI